MRPKPQIAVLFAAVALAVVPCAGLAVAAEEADPPTATPGPDPNPVASPAVVHAGEVAVLSVAAAKEVFGTSDRNGTDSPDAYTIVFDDETGAAWAPVFKDERPAKAQIGSVGGTVTGPLPSSAAREDSLVIRISGYEKAQVDSASEQISAVLKELGMTAAYYYNPAVDAIEVEGEPGVAKQLGDAVGGVRLVHTTSNDISLDFYNDGVNTPPF
ncbi:MAG: hypothetical protein LBE08_06150 [Bifidobacteriaceae bacterium]|jgi:hypothetical protein|nr:hypothetical protein [Bifidobacteriaceae bacterium]